MARCSSRRGVLVPARGARPGCGRLELRPHLIATRTGRRCSRRVGCRSTAQRPAAAVRSGAASPHHRASEPRKRSDAHQAVIGPRTAASGVREVPDPYRPTLRAAGSCPSRRSIQAPGRSPVNECPPGGRLSETRPLRASRLGGWLHGRAPGPPPSARTRLAPGSRSDPHPRADGRHLAGTAPCGTMRVHRTSVRWPWGCVDSTGSSCPGARAEDAAQASLIRRQNEVPGNRQPALALAA